MNYLAHAFLSRKDKDLQLGNFIADHIRGNQLQHFPAAVQKGIIMHRAIDTYTDQHPVFRASKRLFYEGFEKYSGVLVDIYFDHLLAKNFSNFSDEGLDSFSRNTYQLYHEARPILPASSTRFLDYVISNNIYQAYANQVGIQTVLKHLSHRLSHGINLQDSMTLFTNNQEQLLENFLLFFTDAKSEFEADN